MCISKDAEYNQMVIENVLNGDDFIMKVECPQCGNEATLRQYDRNDDGCINAYERTDCTHCNDHECDDDSCSICEAAAEVSYAYNKAKGEYYMLLDMSFESFEDTDFSKPVSPVEITNLKLYFLKEVKPICGDDCDHFFADSVKQYLRDRADWNFKQMLNSKIELANQEIYAI
ncbi:hypothetical protein KW507_16025 [Vibrio fluvialis]|nr:hypothetical protein [Vibrio fluvialis]